MNNITNSTVFNNMDFESPIEPMQTGKAKGWLGEYFWVSLPVTDDNKYEDTTKSAIEWCNQHFGKSGHRWFEKKKKFYFKEEKEMTLFMLRYAS